MSKEISAMNEVEDKKRFSLESMRIELLKNDWEELSNYIHRTFRENPESTETKINLQLLRKMIANEDVLAQVKANISVASIYFERVDYFTMFFGFTSVLVTLSGDLVAKTMGSILGVVFTLGMWAILSFHIAKRFSDSKKGMHNIKYLRTIIDTFTQCNKE